MSQGKEKAPAVKRRLYLLGSVVHLWLPLPPQLHSLSNSHLDLFQRDFSNSIYTRNSNLSQGVCTAPFPSMAPPLTLLVDGKQKTLVICLVFDVSPSFVDGSVWFSSGNGTALDAFTYGPLPAGDGTWSSLAQLSLPVEELASWEPLVCHTGPGWQDQSPRTRPLQLSGMGLREQHHSPGLDSV
uniref:Uncharacterized protein n=1 Tax=Vombatus ursinus TaxID=29139 RepID=A0A4X2K8N3_VOMUR